MMFGILAIDDEIAMFMGVAETKAKARKMMIECISEVEEGMKVVAVPCEPGKFVPVDTEFFVLDSDNKMVKA